MIASKILIAVTAIILALMLVLYTAIKMSQPIPSSNEGVSSKLTLQQDIISTYEASQSALLQALDNPYILPYPGILPNHPLYWLKMIRDRMQLISTKDPTQKMQLLLLFADKRLAASQLLLVAGDQVLAVSTATKAEKYLLQAFEIYHKYDLSEQERYRQYLGDTFSRHLIYLDLARSEIKSSIKLDGLNQIQDIVKVIYESQFQRLYAPLDVSTPSTSSAQQRQ